MYLESYSQFEHHPLEESKIMLHEILNGRDEVSSTIFKELKNKPKIANVLRNIVDELPSIEKLIIYKKFWECKLEDEIGYELGLQTRSVAKLMNRSFDYLRERLITEFYADNRLLA